MAWRSDIVDAEQRVVYNGDSAPAKTPRFSTRYRFAIQIDRKFLHMVVHNVPPPREPTHSANPSRIG